MNILNIFVHLGTVIATVKDAEQVISDLLSKKDVGADGKKVLQDLSDLFSGGVLSIPGLVVGDIVKAIADIIAVL